MTGMTMEAFEDFVATWGHVPRRWPEGAEKVAAEALIARAPQAQKILASHRALALALTPLSGAWPLPSAALTERILGDAAAVSAERAPPVVRPKTPKRSAKIEWFLAVLPRPSLLASAAACVASAAFGLWIGLSAPAEMTGAANTHLASDFQGPQEVAALFPWDLE